MQSTSGGAGVSFDGRGTAFMAVPAGSPLHGRRPRRRLPVTGRVGLRLGLGRYRRRRNSRAHPHRRQRVRRRPTRPHPRRALSDVATTLSQGDARISFGKRAASQAASRHSPRTKLGSAALSRTIRRRAAPSRHAQRCRPGAGYACCQRWEQRARGTAARRPECRVACKAIAVAHQHPVTQWATGKADRIALPGDPVTRVPREPAGLVGVIARFDRRVATWQRAVRPSAGTRPRLEPRRSG